MKSKNKSAYSKMYLVTPGVYEKLLKCLEDGDKRVTEDLNKPAEEFLSRPSETALQELGGIDVMSEIADELLPEERLENINPGMPSGVVNIPPQVPQVNPGVPTGEVQIYGPRDLNIPPTEPPTIPTSSCTTRQGALCSVVREPSQSQVQPQMDPEDVPLAARFPRQKRGGVYPKQKQQPTFIAKKAGAQSFSFGYNCPICAKKLSKKSNLTRHLLQVHKTNRRSYTDLPPTVTDPSRFTHAGLQEVPSSFGVIKDDDEVMVDPLRIVEDKPKLILPEITITPPAPPPPPSSFSLWTKKRQTNMPMEGVEKSGRKRTIKRVGFKDPLPPGKSRRTQKDSDSEEEEEEDVEFESWK